MPAFQLPCRVSGCLNMRADWQVTCGAHWRRVPLSAQRLVFREYLRGPSTLEYVRAVRAAVNSVELQEVR